MDSKTLCLAVLLKGDASGYEIKKTLESAPLSHFQDTSFGSIYPALNRLTAHGQAVCREEAQDKRPDKKVYSITQDGRRALVEALLQPPGPDRYRSDFLFVLFLAELLPAGHLAQVVDARIALYDERIAHMEACDGAQGRAAPDHVHGFGLAIYRAAADYLKRHRDEIIAGAAQTDRRVAE